MSDESRVAIYQVSHQELAQRVGQVDCVITDPPFSERVHRGQTADRHDGAQGCTVDGLNFEKWSEADVHTFVSTWAPRVRRWIVVLCSHDLIPVYEHAFRDAGRYVFAPVPCVVRGASVRLSGDGPSSWCVYAMAARPVGMRPLSGTLPGAYVGARERLMMPGGKTTWLMRELIGDYARPGDVICDPCAGTGTTVVCAHQSKAGHRVIGGEPDWGRFDLMSERLRNLEGAHRCEFSIHTS